LVPGRYDMLVGEWTAQMMMNWIVARMISGALASIVVAIVVIIILYAPKPYPGIEGEVSFDADRENGVVKTNYWVGLLKEEWTYENGFPHGLMLQYFPNRSVMRELRYHRGKLQGLIKEYYEKQGFRPGPSERRLVGVLDPKKTVRGNIKGKWEYQSGLKEGRYEIYYERGGLKEKGTYKQGKLNGRIRKFNQIGKVTSEKYYEDGKKASQQKSQQDSEILR
jgi:antitoxin component YwqK of YwqJK toxin-antitoxin module